MNILRVESERRRLETTGSLEERSLESMGFMWSGLRGSAGTHRFRTPDNLLPNLISACVLPKCNIPASLMMVLPDYPDRKVWLYNAEAVLRAQLSVNLNQDGSWPESIRYHRSR